MPKQPCAQAFLDNQPGFGRASRRREMQKIKIDTAPLCNAEKIRDTALRPFVLERTNA